MTGARPRASRSRAVARPRRSDGFLGAQIPNSPWIKRDFAKLLFWQLAGLVGIVITWIGCSGALGFRDQGIWTAFAVLAAAIAASGGAAWLLTGLAAVSRERRLLRTDIAALYGFTDRATAASDTAELALTGFVTADGMRRYHRPSCDVVRGKTVRAARVSGSDADDLQPCGMCQS